MSFFSHSLEKRRGAISIFLPLCDEKEMERKILSAFSRLLERVRERRKESKGREETSSLKARTEVFLLPTRSFTLERERKPIHSSKRARAREIEREREREQERKHLYLARSLTFARSLERKEKNNSPKTNSYRWMQSRWKTWPQQPQAIDRLFLKGGFGEENNGERGRERERERDR